MRDQAFTRGEAAPLTANAFTREGYYFTHWNTLSDGSGISYSDQQSITLNIPITLYAQWAPIDFYENGSTLTVSGDASVSANLILIEIIPYIDADGNTAYCSDYTTITEEYLESGNDVVLTAGAWYVVKDDLYVTVFFNDSTVSGSGAANIILCDGAEFDLRCTSYCDGKQLVITLPGYLEAYDAIGRCLFVRELDSFPNSLPATLFPGTGVYLLRLDEKSQKIVIR